MNLSRLRLGNGSDSPLARAELRETPVIYVIRYFRVPGLAGITRFAPSPGGPFPAPAARTPSPRPRRADGRRDRRRDAVRDEGVRPPRLHHFPPLRCGPELKPSRCVGRIAIF